MGARSNWVASCVLALVSLFASTAVADRLILKSGRTVEGVIVNETDADVEVSFGMGSVTVSRHKIARMERSSEEERASIQSEFDQRREEQRLREPPDAYKSLDARLWGLAKRRGQARKAVSNIERIDNRRAGLEESERKGEKAYRKWNNRLATLSPRSQYKEYTDTLEKVNKAAARTNEARARLREDREAKEKLKGRIGAYMEDLAALEIDFARVRYDVGQLDAEQVDAQTSNWLARASVKLNGFLGDIRTMHVPTETRGKSHLVTAQLNNKAAGTFIVDTGASVVTISASMAKRLGISYRSTRSVQLTLADGSSVTAYPIKLKSVAVGDAVVRHVRAVVIEQPPGPGIDGLLGMTFLGEFSMSFHAKTGVLELTRFGGQR